MNLKKITPICVCLILYVLTVNAQTKDTLQQKKVDFYQKQLSLDNAKANQVSGIMDAYKESVKKVSGDNTLSEQQKRSKIDLLISDKNVKLKKVLTDAQFQKIVPTSEVAKKSN